MKKRRKRPARRSWKSAAVLLFVFILQSAFRVPHSAARPLPSAGARSLALGNAYVAEKEDVNVLFFNPAGLTGLNGAQMSFNYGRFDPGGPFTTTELHAAFGKPTDFQGTPIGAAGGFLGRSLGPGVHQFTAFAAFGADVPTRGLLPWPVRGGGALKLRQQKGDDKDVGVGQTVGKTEFGLGLDGGALVEFTEDLSVGVALRDLYTGGVNPPGPQFRVGARYRHRFKLNWLADIEMRKNVTSLHTGVEWMMVRDLLKLRLGNGFSAGSVDHVAVGAGFNYSPAQIDVAYVLPTSTFNDPSDHFRVTFIYRFHAPKFSELYYDRALDMADDVDRRVEQMAEREAQLKGSLADLEQARRLAEEDLARASVRRTEGERALEERLLRSESRAVEAERRAQELESKVRAAEEKIRRSERLGAPAPAPKKPEVRKHTVAAGDSLRTLAEKYYGDAELWRKIYDANRGKVDRGRLTPGSELVIPD